jgi:hypothetical protein
MILKKRFVQQKWFQSQWNKVSCGILWHLILIARWWALWHQPPNHWRDANGLGFGIGTGHQIRCQYWHHVQRSMLDSNWWSKLCQSFLSWNDTKTKVTGVAKTVMLAKIAQLHSKVLLLIVKLKKYPYSFRKSTTIRLGPALNSYCLIIKI